MIDSHCHLHLGKADPCLVLDRAAAAGVRAVVQIATDLPSYLGSESLKAQRGESRPRINLSVALTPAHARLPDWRERLAELRSRVDPSLLVAWGEMGMDFHRDAGPEAEQAELFRRQLAFAVELDLPVVIHCRRAFAAVQAVLDEFAGDSRLRGVWHCFEGSLAEAEVMMSRGFYISVSGLFLRPGTEALRAAIAGLPLERVVLETDSPYLTPPPGKGRENEPALLAAVVAAVAGLRDLAPEAIVEATSANCQRLFPRLAL